MPEIKRDLKLKMTKIGNVEFVITHKHSFADIIRHLIAEGCYFDPFLTVYLDNVRFEKAK
jgi:hypothetical protein